MITSYARLIYRWRYLVLLASLAVVAVLGSGLSKLVLSTNLEVFFAPDDPALAEYDMVRNTYTRDDNIYLVYTPADEKIFTRENLAIVEEITAAAWQIPHAMRVDSITNFQHTRAQEDDLAVAPLVEHAQSMTDEELAYAKSIALNEPFLLGKLIPAQAHITGINVTIQLPNLDRSREIPEAIFAARALREHIQQTYPGADLKITGKTAGNFSFTEAALADLSTIVPIAFGVALLCILGFLYFASGSVLSALLGTLSTIIIIICAVAVGMGFAGLAGIEITPPMSNAPTVILTLAVADCMHILMNFYQARRSGDNKENAIVHSLVLNAQPVLLTSLTTIIGFLALNFSDAPPFRDLGNAAAVGILAAWILSMTLLPALLAVLPSWVTPAKLGHRGAMEKLADVVLKRPRTFFVLSSLAIVTATAGVAKNELYDVWAEYFDPSTAIRQDSDFARKWLNGFNTLEYSLGAGTSGGVAEPEYLQRLESFANWLREQPEVMHVITFTDIMKRLNRNMHGDDEAWYRLPTDRNLAAQYLLLYEFSLPFGLDLTNLVNLDKSSTRLIAGLRGSSTKEVLALQARSVEWLAANAPLEFRHPGASSDAMFAHIGQRNVRSMLMGSMIGLLAISLIIAIALRSWGYGLLSLCLNLLPMLVGFGIWGFLVGRIGMGLSVVSGLTMGIVVDFTVHLLSKYQLAQQRDGLSTPDAIRYAFSTVGAALVVTTAVLIANFGLLTFSVFTLNSELGELTAGIIFVALLIDLFFLPPVLLFLGRRKESAAAPLSPAYANP